MVCYISPRETETAALSKTGLISQVVFKRKFVSFSSPFARFISGVLVLLKDDTEGFVQYPLRISTVDYHGVRIAFHFS